jgi:hypothetical protein
VECFVGFQIHRNRRQRTLRIHQTLYITKLLERLRMDQANPTKLPIPAGTVLKDTGEEPLNPNDTTVYQQIVGSAIYLANNTRPDIAYAVGQLACYMSKPAQSHLQLAKMLLRYLKGTVGVGITYSNHREEGRTTHTIYSDSTWGTVGMQKGFCHIGSSR